jgi:hypothetical protein
MNQLPSKADLIADLKALQELYPDQRITRNFYRHHGHYSESQWQYYYPVFSAFKNTLHESSSRFIPTNDDKFGTWLDAVSFDVGDVVAIDGARHKVIAKGPASIRTKRHYWYHDLFASLLAYWFPFLKDPHAKAPNNLP